MEAGEASTQGISKRSMTSMLGVPLRRKTSFQGPEGFGGLDDATRKKLAEEAGRGSRVWKRLDAPPHYAADADKRKMPVRVPGKGRRRSVAACLSKAKEAMMGKDDKDKPAESSAESIPEGFCKRSRGGLKAMRVPFDNFGGYVVNNSGNKVQPLHLIIEAVSDTNDYTVFSSKPLEIMLQHKWDGFAFRGFLKSLGIFSLHLLIATIYNVLMSQRLDLTIESIVGADGSTPEIAMLLGWTWTTVLSVIAECNEFNQVRSAGLRMYMSDYNNALDQVFICGQLLINIMFWIRTDTTKPVLFAGGIPHYDDSVTNSSSSDVVRRLLKARGSAEASGGVVPSDNIGVFLTFQSAVMLALFLRLVGYLRGFLALGALINMIVQVFREIIPFMSLLLITTLGFSFTLHIALQHTTSGRHSLIEGDPEADWQSIETSIFASVNMGLYSVFKEPPMKSHWQVIIIFEIFMLGVQIVLLNLLIAIMTETHTRLRNVSKLVAHFERAKMVLEEEQKLSPKSLYPEDGQAANSEELGDLEDGKGGILGVLGRAISHVTGACSSKVPTVDEAAPRWLHVLLPAELEREEDAESQELKRIIALDSSIHSLHDVVMKEQQKLVDMVAATEKQLRERDKRDMNQRETIQNLIRSEIRAELNPDLSTDYRGRSSSGSCGSRPLTGPVMGQVGSSPAAVQQGLVVHNEWTENASTPRASDVAAVMSEMRVLQKHIAQQMDVLERATQKLTDRPKERKASRDMCVSEQSSS